MPNIPFLRSLAWAVLPVFLAGCPRAAPAPAAVDAARAPVLLGNSLCPVSGEPVAGTPNHPTFTAQHEGYTLGFMCPAHLAEFERGTPEEKTLWLAKARTSVVQ